MLFSGNIRDFTYYVALQLDFVLLMCSNMSMSFEPELCKTQRLSMGARSPQTCMPT